MPASATGEAAARHRRVAVVDIGSNTVRLVIFEGPARVPIPLFNEKASCGLGRGLDRTGRLHPDGVTLAMEALTRYARLSAAIGIDRLDLLATAAVRDAEDGPEFARRVEAVFGHPVQVLSGAEEAELSAHGVLCGVPDADGLVGDLGGGSLDLVELDRGRFGRYATVPLGHLRLHELAPDGPADLDAHVDGHLGGLGWLAEGAGRTLYAVGGAWRAVARIFIEQTGYPLHILDNFSIARYEAETLLDVIAGLSRTSLEKIERIPRRRLDSLPHAARVMRHLLRRARPRQVVFSSYGMREGQFLRTLPEALRGADPLISACRHIARHSSRFGMQGDEVFAWLSPVFAGEGPAERRIRHAASLLIDIAWMEHPDYRGEHAFDRVLRLPVAGLSHRERAMMAFAVSLRHDSERKLGTLARVRSLLDDESEQHARTIGVGLRLANTLSGGAPGLLASTRLRRDHGALVLELPRDGAMFMSEVVQRRLQTLARTLGVEGEVEYGAAPAG